MTITPIVGRETCQNGCDQVIWKAPNRVNGSNLPALKAARDTAGGYPEKRGLLMRQWKTA